MTTSATAKPTKTLPLPFWPASPFDPDRARVSYDVPADELLVSFDRGRRSGGICDPIGLAEGTIAVVYDGETGESVGIQAIPSLLAAVRRRPAWAALAWGRLAGTFGEPTLDEGLPDFIAEVAPAFGRSGLAGAPLTEVAVGAPSPR